MSLITYAFRNRKIVEPLPGGIPWNINIFTYHGTYQITMGKSMENPLYVEHIYIYINIYKHIYIYNYICNYIYESIKMRNSSALRLDGLRWLKEVVSGLFFYAWKNGTWGTSSYIRWLVSTLKLYYSSGLNHSISILYSVMFGVPWGY